MTRIGMETISAATDLVGGLLQDYATEINSAFPGPESKGVRVSLMLTFAPEVGGDVLVTGTIGFLPKGRIKDTAKVKVAEHQAKLFEMKKEVAADV